MKRLPLLVALLAAVAISPAPINGGAATNNRTFIVAPSGADDTQRLQAALDAASGAGPGAVIKLSTGTFHVGRPLIGTNLNVTIRGAGMGKTEVLGDGAFNPDGLFQLVPPDEVAALRSLSYPVLFLFHEGDVDRFGQNAHRRSQRVLMTYLTLGARGRTIAHYDINEDADT